MWPSDRRVERRDKICAHTTPDKALNVNVNNFIGDRARCRTRSLRRQPPAQRTGTFFHLTLLRFFSFLI